MKNHQYLRQLKVKEFALYLIRSKTVPDYDEDIDGEWRQCGTYTEYIAPDGRSSLSYEDALRYTIDWLNAEHRTTVNIK